MTSSGSVEPVGDVDAERASRPLARVAVVAVLALDAVLLAATELAWLGLYVGSVPLPLAVLVAALTTPLLVLAADSAMPGTAAPFVVFGAWLLPVLVAGLWSPSPMGAGVLVADWRAILLVLAGFAGGLWALGRRPGTERR